MSFFEVGDDVVDIIRGKGKVIRVDINSHTNKLPICVSFQGGCEVRWFTPEGRYTVNDFLPTLYHAEGFTAPAAPEPERCPFKEWDAVLVRDSKEECWQVHKFIKMTLPERRFVTTCGNEITHSYKECILYKGNELLLDSLLEPEESV